MGIMHCKSLMECDAYFDDVLAKSEYRQLLGSIDLSSEELDHLCTLILRDTDWTYLTPVPSLSISIFLVYIGIHYYRDSYWPSVFEKLMLPEYNRHRYQEFLGKTFLCTLKKYNLLNFESGYRYVTPILVHGCVPDAYLDEFFSGVMLYIYRDRRELSLDFNETQHLLDTYRRAYQRRHKRGQYLNGLKKYEEELRIALDKTRNYSRLKRIENLQKRIVEFEELNMLLNYEEDWLDKAQAKHERMVYFYDKQLEINNIINEVKLKQARLNRDLSIVTEKLFNKQDNSLTSFIGSMPIDEILVLVKDLVRFHRYFFGFWRRQAMNKHLYRRYKRIGEMQSRIQEKIYPVKFKHQVFVQPYNLLRDLQRLKDLITDKKILENQLKQVKDSQEQVAVALEEENLVPGDISGWQKQITQLYREIVDYKMNLVRLGRGDLEFGQEVLEEQRNLRREINYQKSAIVSNYDVDTLLEKMADHEDEYNEDKILKRLRTVREHIEVNESRLNETFEPLYFLNESIRIFLFKGGDTADRFLFNLLLLMQKLDRGEEDLRSVRLPERIINAMEEWWQDKGRFILDEVYDEVEREKAQEDKIMFRRPVIKLDRLRHCIIAEIPEQRVFGSNNVVIRVANADDELHRVELPVMKSGQEFYIQACQFEIKKLLPTYKFEYVQGSITCNIEVKMWDIKRPYILFSKNGQFIDKIRSSDEGVYIVVPRNSKIHPETVLREKGSLTVGWSSCDYYYLDFEQETLAVLELLKKRYIIMRPVKQSPQLVGGDKLDGIKAENCTVYSGRMPELIFSADSNDELFNYGILLEGPRGTNFISLGNADIVLNENGLIRIPLDDKIQGGCGIYKIALVLREQVLWRGEFGLVPDINVEFDKEVYLPRDDAEPIIGRVNISSKYPFTLTTHQEAEIVESSNFSYLLEFDARREMLCLNLKYSILTEEFDINVSIDIPSLRWCIKLDDKWHFDVGEIWYEDAEQLMIQLPNNISKGVELVLVEDREGQGMERRQLFLSEQQVIKPVIRDSIAVFDLRRLNDAFQESNACLETLVLRFNEKTIPPCLIVRVRLVWQVDDVTVEQDRDGDYRRMFIKWNDLGRASSRILRFWPVGIPEADMVEYQIPDGASELEIVESIDKLPAGQYRLQFDMFDMWSPKEVVFPRKGQRNCKEVVIGARDEILDYILKYRLGIKGFEHEGREIKCSDTYWIQDIQVCSEFEGDEGFIGYIYTVDAEGKPIGMKYNPVSFYIDSDLGYLNRLPFLIDRDRDGATYCLKCGQLFWDVDKHRGCRSHVIVPDYIFVEVRRDT